MSKVAERVKSIYYSEVKSGEYITLKDDNKTYCVIQHGQTYHLLPVDLKNIKHVGFYDLEQPKIKALYNAKNGNCIKVVDDEKKSHEEDI